MDGPGDAAGTAAAGAGVEALLASLTYAFTVALVAEYFTIMIKGFQWHSVQVPGDKWQPSAWTDIAVGEDRDQRIRGAAPVGMIARSRKLQGAMKRDW